jgi:putative flippase GtrA
MLHPAALTRLQDPPARSPLAGLLGKRARLVRFALTGGAAGLTQLALLNLLAGRGLVAVAANVIAFLIAAQVNFWTSLLFTWRDRRPVASSSGLLARWLRFHGAIAGTALLNMGVFAAASTALPHLAAAALGIGVAAAANFVLGDRLVFRAASPGRRERPGHARVAA